MLSILTQFLSNRAQHVMVDGCRGKLGILFHECRCSERQVIVLYVHTTELLPILEIFLIGYAGLMAVVPSPQPLELQ